MSHPVYKPPLRFVLRLRLQKGGRGVFDAGHYGSTIWICSKEHWFLGEFLVPKTKRKKNSVYIQPRKLKIKIPHGVPFL